MYSPKIKEDLIPILYRIARERGKAMTRIVDDILRPVVISLEAEKAIPYCMSCYSKVELPGEEKPSTAYCSSCESETVLIYTLPNEAEAS